MGKFRIVTTNWRRWIEYAKDKQTAYKQAETKLIGNDEKILYNVAIDTEAILSGE
jgi:hypothetical protein